MSKDFWYTVGGTILGSLVEEGIEEIFPGVGELNWTGEISGAIAGLLSSQLTKDEVNNSIKIFVRYAYRFVNKDNAPNDISDEELKVFSDNFHKVPFNKKKEIINNFKTLSPYEYSLIVDFLKEFEGETNGYRAKYI